MSGCRRASACASDSAGWIVWSHDHEPEELGTESLGAPESVIARQGADELANLGARARTPECRPRLPTPLDAGICPLQWLSPIQTTFDDVRRGFQRRRTTCGFPSALLAT